MPVSLHLMSSPEDAWENVVRPWFETVASCALQNQPAAVVTASRTQAYSFRSRLLADGRSLFGVRFLSPAQLRNDLLWGCDLRVPLREHLRLLLAVTAEEFSNSKREEETLLVAKSAFIPKREKQMVELLSNGAATLPLSHGFFNAR